MGDWPAIQDIQAAEGTPKRTGNYSYPRGLLTSGAANTKGNYVELITASKFAATGLILHIGYSDSYSDWLLDLAVGAAGSEVVIASNLMFSHRIPFYLSMQIMIPGLHIPIGSRVSARAQASGASTVMLCGVHLLYGANHQSLSMVESYGPNTADSGGVSVDPGAVAHTYGNYSEIGTTVRTCAGFFVMWGNQGQSRASGNWMVDIAVGAAGSEVPILSGIYLSSDSFAPLTPPSFPFIPFRLPSGTRLSCRAYSDVTGATRVFDVAVYGVS